MGDAYHSIVIHYVFSTKDRAPQITGDLRDRLYAFIGGILKKHGVKALSVGGTSDHVHILASLPTTVSVSKAVQLAKGGSSKWVHLTFPERSSFAWQEGYGAFSVSMSHIPESIAYIARQENHHRKRTFKEEYLEFLKKHDVEYDERYIWK